MARSTIDLEELRKFRDSLDTSNKEIANLRKNLITLIEESRKFWDDDQRRIFEAKVSSLTLPMQLFEKRAMEHCDWADRKCAAGWTYLGGRP